MATQQSRCNALALGRLSSTASVSASPRHLSSLSPQLILAFTRAQAGPCRCCDSAVCRALAVTVQSVHSCTCSLLCLHPQHRAG